MALDDLLEKNQNKINEEEEEYVDIDEIAEKAETNATSQQALSPAEEQLTLLVLDVGTTRRGLYELYTTGGDAYVIDPAVPLEKVEEIMNVVRRGEIALVEATRLKFYKRIMHILSVKQTKKLKKSDIPPIVSGVLDVYATSLIIVSSVGERVYLAEGSVNYAFIDEHKHLLKNKVVKVAVSQLIQKNGLRGTYYIARGLLLIKPKPAELIALKQEEADEKIVLDEVAEEKEDEGEEEEFVAEV